MSRAKQYNRPELLDRAVEIFRRKGFNGTSTAPGVSACGPAQELVRRAIEAALRTVLNYLGQVACADLIYLIEAGYRSPIQDLNEIS